MNALIVEKVTIANGSRRLGYFMTNTDSIRLTGEAHWIGSREFLPPENKVVETCIYDHKGRRNQQPLQRRGNLWYVEDGSMYVYYTPTHWRELCYTT